MSDGIDFKRPGNSCAGGFDGLKGLLPEEEEDLLILEERCLLHDASILIKKQKALFRIFGGKSDAGPTGRPLPKKAPQKLSNSIDPGELNGRLISLMENDRLYLNEHISLTFLANALDVEPHQLTFYLNRSMHMRFHDFINRYRIKAAKEHLKAEPEEGILSIAFKSGFNSKASFNRIFKKITGQTPSQYRRTPTRISADS